MCRGDLWNYVTNLMLDGRAVSWLHRHAEDGVGDRRRACRRGTMTVGFFVGGRSDGRRRQDQRKGYQNTHGDLPQRAVFRNLSARARTLSAERDVHAIHDAESVTVWQMAGVVPTTLAGIAALLSYVVEYTQRGTDWPDDLVSDDGRSGSFENYVMRNCVEAIANLAA